MDIFDTRSGETIMMTSFFFAVPFDYTLYGFLVKHHFKGSWLIACTHDVSR